MDICFILCEGMNDTLLDFKHCESIIMATLGRLIKTPHLQNFSDLKEGGVLFRQNFLDHFHLKKKNQKYTLKTQHFCEVSPKFP